MRLIFSVLTGYLVFAVSSALLFQIAGHDPHAVPGMRFSVASALWGMFFAAAGGILASRGAKRPTLVAAAWVAGLIAAGAFVSILLDRSAGIGPQLATLLLVAPSAYTGGLISRRTHR
jgi:hypothetical protein